MEEETFVEKHSKGHIEFFSENISNNIINDFIGECIDKIEIDSIISDLKSIQEDTYDEESTREIINILERRNNKKYSSNSIRTGILAPIPKRIGKTKSNPNLIERVSRPINISTEL